MRILVTSNCQTGGIAAALKALMPASFVQTQPYFVFADATQEAHFFSLVKDYDVWITNMPAHWVQRYHEVHGGTVKKVIRIPSLFFAAFHPDLRYARHGANGPIVTPHYNSAVAMWAYNHGHAPESAASLFCQRNFEDLGFLDMWSGSVARMKAEFEITDLGDLFDTFLQRIKRRGTFMYAVNHPRAWVLAHLGKLIAMKIGMSRSVLNQDLEISDGLTDVVWPVYPEVANSLGLDGGSYLWRLDNWALYDGPLAYCRAVFAQYRESGIAPGELVVDWPDQARFDAVLSR